MDVKLGAVHNGEWVGQINALLINPPGWNHNRFYSIHFIHHFIIFSCRLDLLNGIFTTHK